MKNKILFVISLLFGLMMINAGLNKFLEYIPVPPDLPEKIVSINEMLAETGFMSLIAIAEIVGGILVIFPKTRALGAIILAPVIAGIVVFHLTMAPEGLILAFVVLAIELWIIFENRKKYLYMITP